MALLVLILTLFSTTAAQDLPIDPSSKYLVLSTHRTATMQKELDTAAKEGFRVVASLPRKDEVVVFLERVRKPASAYSYRLLATYRTSTMEKELNEAGRDGFRFVSQTTIERGDEVILIMERDATTDQRYEYRLLATQRKSTLEKELNDAGRAGFTLKGTFMRDETMAVLERPFNVSGP